MQKTDQHKIEQFKKSRDYRDICYMIDHVANIDVRNSCLEALGYKIGINVVTKNMEKGLKHVIIGKKKEFRIQSVESNSYIAECVICKG